MIVNLKLSFYLDSEDSTTTNKHSSRTGQSEFLSSCIVVERLPSIRQFFLLAREVKFVYWSKFAIWLGLRKARKLIHILVFAASQVPRIRSL